MKKRQMKTFIRKKKQKQTNKKNIHVQTKPPQPEKPQNNLEVHVTFTIYHSSTADDLCTV